MIYRDLKLCDNCPFQPVDLRIPVPRRVGKVKINLCDIDGVLEIGNEISAIFELKRYKNGESYRWFYIPAHEFVLYKKLAQALSCDFFFVIESEDSYFVHRVNKNGRRRSHKFRGIDQKQVTFHRSEFLQLDRDGFEGWLREFCESKIAEAVKKPAMIKR